MNFERLKELKSEVSSIVFVALSKLTDKNARANVVKFGEDLQELINEAIAHQSATTETITCEWCDNGIDSASVMSADMMMRFVRPVNYCPNCGRRLED